MTYVASTPPDITEGLPAVLSARQASVRSSSSNVLYDVVISGIGFVLAASSNNPYQRQSEQFQKEQIDTSVEAGEQTLGGPWVRSQTSWHFGAGADYYDPGTRDDTQTPTRYRFKDSRGVNVWTQGQLTLLPKMDPVDESGAAAAVAGARHGGEDIWFAAFGTTLRRHAPSGDADYALGGSAVPNQGLVVAGDKLLLGGGYGIYAAPLSGGAPAALCTQALNTDCYPYWVKSRIGITRGPELFFMSLAGGDIDTTTPHWTHPDSTWEWTGMAETPDAILAAGHSGGRSAIFALVMTEDSGGTVPKLSQPFQVAELPPGEEILAIRSYLGRYLGIGTTLGIRVAVIGQSGQVQYGPLLVETDAPVTSLEARSSFLYAAAGSVVYRVSLDEAIDQALRFPYAADVEVPDGETIDHIAFVGVTDQIVASVNGVGTYASSTTEYVSSGWIESGDIRFGTTEPKAFRTVDVVTTTPGDSTVAVAAVASGATQNLVTLGQGKGGHGISLGSLPSLMPQIGYRLTLNGGTDTPTVDAVAIKAIPLPTRQRLVLYPLHVADDGRDGKGAPYGKTGYASTVLEALEALENSQTIVTVNDLTRPEQFEATIEQVRFTRVRGRAKGGAGNFGGIAEVTVRTL